jgi:hypothetical protein
VLIQAVNGRINASSGSLHVSVLQALGEAMLSVAQLDDQAFSFGEASPEVNRSLPTLASSWARS